MPRPSSHTINTLFIERLISGISHDIGASARHVVQFSEMLNDANDLSLDDKYRRWLKIINNGGEQIQVMLSSLSELSLLTKRADDLSELNLLSLFQSSLNSHKENTLKNNVKLNVALNDTWPTIFSCKEHWQTLFSCLIENAIRFQPASTEHTIQLDCQCICTDSELKFDIEDNGIGATEAQRKEMSRPFKRLNTHDEYPGLGMGLTYCDYIAELNNGSLTFLQSEFGGLHVSYVQPIEKTPVFIPSPTHK